MTTSSITEPHVTANTPLHALHMELGARFVPFAGYAMPLQYATGIIAEHNHVRSHAGLFDISHMGQIRIHGKDAGKALEALMPSDIIGLAPLRQRYSVFTNDNGGILDDLIVTRMQDHFHLIVNAACKDNDYRYVKDAIGTKFTVELLQEQALLALQGPDARDVLTRFAAPLKSLPYMTTMCVLITGLPCVVFCSGYTGEDGFEISVAAEHAEQLARKLLSCKEVRPIGLGARDSLRLEAGLCLYGHDLDTNISPVEAGLAWVIQKSRRIHGERSGGYPGSTVIDAQLANGIARVRVGLEPQGKAPVREGARLIDANEQEVGLVTSGGYSPTLERPIAMGYVASALADTNTSLITQVRNRMLPVAITDLPFIAARRFQ